MHIMLRRVSKCQTAVLRGLSKLCLACLVLSHTCTSVYGGELGVNYNGVLSQINTPDLQRTKARIVRCFVDYFEYRSNPKKWIQSSDFGKLIQLKESGYRTILNIKFNYEKRNLPIGDKEIQSDLSLLPALLTIVYPISDYLVCGNEPFIESKKDQRDERLSSLYIAIAKSIHSFRQKQGRSIPLYIGAFDNLWKKPWQTKTAKALLSFGMNSPWIAGIDLHIHHTLMSDINATFEFVEPYLRPSQNILITEFSLKNQWKLHLTDGIPVVLAQKYRVPAGWKVYQYLNQVIHRPVSRDQWVEFLANSPWFVANKNYITEAMMLFQANPRFLCATYGAYQNAPKVFTQHTDPWIINPLFVNRTVVPDAKTGRPQTNYCFFDEFVKFQQMSEMRFGCAVAWRHFWDHRYNNLNGRR